MPQNELCIASGPGKDMFDSTRIIATKQFEMGKVKIVILSDNNNILAIPFFCRNFTIARLLISLEQ